MCGSDTMGTAESSYHSGAFSATLSDISPDAMSLQEQKSFGHIGPLFPERICPLAASPGRSVLELVNTVLPARLSGQVLLETTASQGRRGEMKGTGSAVQLAGLGLFSRGYCSSQLICIE
jgi:hypothetical protein